MLDHPIQENLQLNPLLPASDQRLKLLETAVQKVNRFYENLEHSRVKPDVEADQVRGYLKQFDFGQSMDPADLLEEISTKLKDWNLHVPHPRYFGLFNPTPSIHGIVADLLVAGFNPQLGAWHHSPIGVEIEAHLIRYFAKGFGLPTTAFGHFTSGGSEANFSAVVIALTRKFPEFTKEGVQAIEGRPTIYCSKEFHHSFVKIAHQCGLGRSAIRMVDVDENYVMDVQALEKKIASDRQNGMRPFMVVATAGTTNAGLIEPIQEIFQVCKTEELHFHVDAAWGGALVLSESHRHLLNGIKHADTVTFDAHKLLSVPMGAGMIIVREHQWLRKSFGLQTDYVPQSPTEELDNYRHSAQFSRRFIGLKLFMALAAIGKSEYGAIIDQQLLRAVQLGEKLTALGFQVRNNLSLGVVCFVPPQDWNFKRHEQFENLAEQVCKTGDAWISTTRLGGKSVFRVCITSHLTRESDLERLIDLIQQCHAGDAAEIS